MKIAIQGDPGSNHHVVTQKIVSNANYELYCAKSFSELFSAVNKNEADFGILAIENSIAGSIVQNYDLISKYHFEVFGEAYLRIEHCLIGFPGVSVSEITAAYSHEMALKQCEDFLSEHQIEGREYFDTAASVPFVKNSGDKHFAAIAPAIAADIWDMAIIQKGIETNKDNYTRFIVAAPHERAEKAKNFLLKGLHTQTKVMIEFGLKDEPGSLAIILAVLATYGFNLTKIESRPIIGDKWKYRFFVDFVSAKTPAEIDEGLKEVASVSEKLKIHGIFSVGQYFG